MILVRIIAFDLSFIFFCGEIFDHVIFIYEYVGEVIEESAV